MSENIKYDESLNELIRYRNNRMSDKERNEFERALERDPFLAEALDGFNEFRTSDIEHDLNALDVITGKKRRKVRPIVYLSVAASLLILVVSSLFVFREKPNDVETKFAEVQPVHESKALMLDTTIENAVVVDSVGCEDEIRAGGGSPVLLAEAKKEVKKQENTKPEKKLASESKTKKVAASKKVDNEEAVVKSEARKKAPTTKREKPLLISDDEDSDRDKKEEPVAEASDNIQEREFEFESSEASGEAAVPVVVSAKTSVTKESLDETVAVKTAGKRIGVNANPKPIGGENVFDVYVETNLRYPSSVEKSKREIVKVRFDISKTGELSNFVIVKSPDNEDFSNEAIRVLKNGPKWSPAVKDGIPVAGNATVKIVFKPSND